MTNDIVGRNIKQMRDDLGLSQEALAAQAGVSKFTVHKIEHGAPAHGSTLRRIADALGTTLSVLREGVPYESRDIAARIQALKAADRARIEAELDRLESSD